MLGQNFKIFVTILKLSMIKCYYLLPLIFLFNFSSAIGQQPTCADGIESNNQKKLSLKLEQFLQEHPKEKVHVHFDKSIYAVGDTVWYKVYLVNGYNNQLSALSKLVHIEIVNGDGQSQKLRLLINSGMANGHLVLSAQKFKKGTYPFNVYTRLMEHDAQKIYTFNLNVGIKINANLPTASSEVASLQFYPESGALVAGLRSKVVVRSQDAQGNPIAANGRVIDEENNKVAEFATGKSGMGMFALSPKQQGKYRAVLEKSATTKRFELPKVIGKGYVLAVNSINGDTLTVRIFKPTTGQGEVRVVFQANGNIYSVIPVSIVSGSSALKIPKALLPRGLNEVALFSLESNLLANRFFFVPEKKSSNQLFLDRNEYGTRERVKIRLNISDDTGAGVVGGYSIAVAKANEALEENISRRSIWSSLILNKPNDDQGIDPQSETGKATLDMYLITQRLGSFCWDDILTDNKTVSQFTAERSLSIGGKVLKTDGKPMAGAKLSLFAAKNMMLIDTVANENGVFKFENFKVLDSTEVVIRVTNLGNEKNVQIILDEEVSSVTTLVTNQPDFIKTTLVKGEGLDQNQANPIRSKEKVNELKTVEIAAKRRPVIPGSVYPFAAAPPDYTIEGEDLHRIINLTDHLRGRFVGVKVINNKVIGTYKGKEGSMFILLNGQNIEDLSFIDPRSLTGVQIIKGGATAAGMANQFGESLYGQGVCFGIIFLTSNHHNPSFTKVTEQTTGIIRKKIPGFASPKAFSSPNYWIKKEDVARDLRDPLFWKPDITTDKEGMATLDFYTADEKGRYQVTLEGIGINGQITREVTFFNVK